MKDKILLIVSVLEGRNFASNSDGELIIEVVFGGESLATDPVRSAANPKFDAELAWELDKQGLKLHRLQRSPVKLNCYLCNSRGKKENMGYLVLDIREARESRAQYRWCRLLNSKFDKLKPELLLGVYLEHESNKRPVEVEAGTSDGAVFQRNRDERQQPTNLSVPKVKGSFSSEQLKPRLNSSESYYQIGPVDKCTEYFTLSVTLVFAENLSQLPHGLASIPVSPGVEGNFRFTYSLLGNSVTTDSFHSLTSAEFPAERATVRIRSNLDALYSYFKKERGLEVQLLCESTPIASTEVHLENLIETNHSGSFKNEMKVDGVFILAPASCDRCERSELSAAVGVSVVLQKEVKEESVQLDDVSSGSFSTGTKIEENGSSGIEVNIQEAVLPSKINLDGNKNGNQPKKNDSMKEHDVHDAVPVGLQNGKRRNHKELGGVRKQETTGQRLNGPAQQSDKPNGSTLQNGSMTTIRPGDDDLHVHHRFHFILDLKSLQMGLHVKPFECFLRYSYPFFGSPTSILTHPSVRVLPTTNVLLPHGYCSFDFLTSPQNIRGTFRDIPLMVEVLEELPGHLEGRMVGLSKICLHPVLESSPSRSTDQNGVASLRRSISTRVPVVSPDGKNIGELKIVAGLDDFGVADISEVLTRTVRNISGPDASIRQIYDNSVAGVTNAQAENGSDNRLLHMMMELEVWKEQQEVLFRNQLKTRESEHLQTLTAEWKQRDLERELIVQKNLQECKRHEDKLKSALTDIEVRERQLSINESDLKAKRTEMAVQVHKVKDEAKDTIRRIKMECDYKIELENKRAADMVQEKHKLQLQIAEKDKKLKEREQTIETLQKKLQGTSEIKLQAEIEIMNIEKAELNRKLEVVTSAKNRYKEQWGKALKQISSLQQQMNSLEKTDLSSRLNSLHLAPLTVDEQSTLDHEKKALAKIKEEVDFLKRRMQNQSDTESFNSSVKVLKEAGGGARFNLQTPRTQSTSDVASGSKTVADGYVQQLLDARDLLLNTGVYSKSDRIVAELEKHIDESSARSFNI